MRHRPGEWLEDNHGGTRYEGVHPSPYWTGTHHGTRWICVYCGNYYLTKRGLVNHLDGNHYEVSPREREDEKKRDDREFGTQEYDDDANRQDQRETRRDYED